MRTKRSPKTFCDQKVSTSSVACRREALTKSVLLSLLVSVAAISLPACNEFIDDDLPTDNPRRPRLVEGAETQPATIAARAFSPEDQKRADDAIATLEKETDRRKLIAAMKVVTELSDPRAASAMLSIVREMRMSPADVEFVGILAESMARTRNENVSIELVAILKNATQSRQLESAALLLQRIRDPRSVQPLIELTRGDKSSWPAIMAAKTLAQIGGPAALDALVESTRAKTLGHERWYHLVCQALADLPDNAGVPTLFKLWEEAQTGESRQQIMNALVGKRDPAVETLAKKSLADESIWVQLAALKVLVSVESSEAWPALVAAMKSKSELLRNMAITEMAMSKVAAPHEVEYLNLALAAAATDPDAWVRSSAIGGLQFHIAASPRRIVAASMAAMKDREPWVRATAATALAIGRKMKPGVGSARDVVAQLTAALSDDDGKVSEAAARSLLSFGEKEAVKAYLEKARKKMEGLSESEKAYRKQTFDFLESTMQKDAALPPAVPIVDNAGELLEGTIPN